MVAVSLLQWRGYFFSAAAGREAQCPCPGAKLLLEKEVMSGADLKDIMAAH